MNIERFFDDRFFNIDVILGKTRRSLKDLKNLREGTIIILDKLAGGPLDVIVDNIVDNEYVAYAEAGAVAYAEAVAIDDNYGARIIRILADEEPEPVQKIVIQEKNTEPPKSETVIPSQEELKRAVSPEELDDLLSDIASKEDSKVNFFPGVINSDEMPSEEVSILTEENNQNAEKEEDKIEYISPSSEKQHKDDEILSSEEIDQLLNAISSEDDDVEDYDDVKDYRRIKIYDFIHPDVFSSFQMEGFGGFMHRFCSILPTTFEEQISFKLESICQIPEYECYEKNKPSFIDQWKWYSSHNYIELSFDDFVIEQLTGINKQDEFYTKEELSALSAKLGTPFMALLSKALDDYAKYSEVPKMTHIYTAPTPEFLLSPSYRNTDYSNSRKKEFQQKNSSMFVSAKIKVISLKQKEACGYIYLNVPAEDLKKYLDINYYHYSHSDKEPYLDNIEISCDVRLGASKQSISDIMKMDEGTIIELDRLTGEPADFRVNGVTIARGDVIVIDENFGIRLTEIL